MYLQLCSSVSGLHAELPGLGLPVAVLPSTGVWVASSFVAVTAMSQTLVTLCIGQPTQVHTCLWAALPPDGPGHRENIHVWI